MSPVDSGPIYLEPERLAMQLHALHRSLPEGDEIVARTPLQSALTEVEFGFAFDGGGFAC